MNGDPLPTRSRWISRWLAAVLAASGAVGAPGGAVTGGVPSGDPSGPESGGSAVDPGTEALGHLRRLCAAGGALEDPDRSREAAVAASNAFAPGRHPGVELAAFLLDSTLAPECRRVAVRYVERIDADLADADREAVSNALLRLSDAGWIDRDGRRDYEILAARLGAGDPVLERIRRHLAAARDEDRLRGVRMARASRDPRADEALLEYFGQVVEHAWRHPISAPEAIDAAAEKGRGRVIAGLERLIFGSADPATRLAAIAALGRAPIPEAHAVMLRLHRRLSGTDGTGAASGAERHLLAAGLLRATRLGEAFLAEQLRTGPMPQAAAAYALIDRATGLGPPVEPDRVCEALEDYAARLEAAGRPAILATVKRIRGR